jgi:hypothetical protein
VGGSTPTSRNLGYLGELNYILITIEAKRPLRADGFRSRIELNAITLNDKALGSVSSDRPKVWKITGESLTSGFSLTGSLVLVDGVNSAVDPSFVQIEVGYLKPPADNLNQGPVSSMVETQPEPAVLNGTVTVSAQMADPEPDQTNIASAQYSLDDGDWQAMSAQDGFDSPIEKVQASFPVTTVGTHKVCVRGMDSLGKWGDGACQPFTVGYKFDGFFDPIENFQANSAKAGQVVPVKWRLTDANGVAIDNPASIGRVLTSPPVNCSDFAGELNTVEEAAGSSGLQYVGDGYWQFNWKTPKDYADTCRVLGVEFNDGKVSPTANFTFHK